MINNTNYWNKVLLCECAFVVNAYKRLNTRIIVGFLLLFLVYLNIPLYPPPFLSPCILAFLLSRYLSIFPSSLVPPFHSPLSHSFIPEPQEGKEFAILTEGKIVSWAKPSAAKAGAVSHAEEGENSGREAGEET